MKTFKDLKFKPHTTGEGLMSQIFFPNGYGVSVVRFKLPQLSGLGAAASFRNGYGSYTSDESEWELAVLVGNKDGWSLTYDTPITDDVLGYLSDEDVTSIMEKVQLLPNIEKEVQASVATKV